MKQSFLGLMLLAVCSSVFAQDAGANDPFWRHFDERFPQIAGQGETLWAKAGELAEVQHSDKASDEYAALQRLYFQALAVNERDFVIMKERAKDAEQHKWIESRRQAAYQFKKDVKTIKELRAKPDSELSQEDMTTLLRATVSAMRYVYEAEIEANEMYFEKIVEENERLRQGEGKQPVNESESESSTEESNEEPKGEKASKGTYKAYLHSERIRIDDREHDRNHVQIIGAVKNLTDKPARFSFKVLALRANGEVIGLKTVETPVIQPKEVQEIDVRMPVTNSAYVRRVDMQDVRVTPQ